MPSESRSQKDLPGSLSWMLSLEIKKQCCAEDQDAFRDMHRKSDQQLQVRLQPTASSYNYVCEKASSCFLLSSVYNCMNNPKERPPSLAKGEKLQMTTILTNCFMPLSLGLHRELQSTGKNADTINRML